MCGYCVEEDFLYSIIDNSDQIHFYSDDFYLDQSLQETDFLLNYLDSLLNYPDLIQSSYDTAIFRMLEHFIHKGYDQDFIQKLIAIYTPRNISIWFRKHGNSLSENIFLKMNSFRFFESEKEWKNLLINKDKILENSSRVLEHYINCWIYGEGKEKVDQDKPTYIENYGDTAEMIFDPIFMSTSHGDWYNFYEQFTSIFFAFNWVIKFNPKSNLIHTIALNEPATCPMFDGYDLWLQRKAIISIVLSRGVDFLVQNIGSIRSSLWFYLIFRFGKNYDFQEKLSKSGLGLSMEDFKTKSRMKIAEYLVNKNNSGNGF